MVAATKTGNYSYKKGSHPPGGKKGTGPGLSLFLGAPFDSRAQHSEAFEFYCFTLL